MSWWRDEDEDDGIQLEIYRQDAENWRRMSVPLDTRFIEGINSHSGMSWYGFECFAGRFDTCKHRNVGFTTQEDAKLASVLHEIEHTCTTEQAPYIARLRARLQELPPTEDRHVAFPDKEE